MGIKSTSNCKKIVSDERLQKYRRVGDGNVVVGGGEERDGCKCWVVEEDRKS